MNKRSILFLIIYSITIFFIFIYFLFPVQVLKRKIEQKLSECLHGQAEIKEISIHFPAKLKMTGLTIDLPQKYTETGPLSFTIDKADTGIDYLKILTGRLGIKTHLSLMDGEVKARFAKRYISPHLMHISGDIKGISVQDLPLLKQKIGIHLTGSLNGTFNIDFSKEDISKSNGDWSFMIEKGRLMPKHFPAFGYQSITGEGSIKDQQILIEKIAVQGTDLSLMAGGKVKMETKLSKFLIDAEVKMKFLPNFIQKIGGFASLLPRPDEDGFISLFIYGPPDALRFSSQKKSDQS